MFETKTFQFFRTKEYKPQDRQKTKAWMDQKKKQHTERKMIQQVRPPDQQTCNQANTRQHNTGTKGKGKGIDNCHSANGDTQEGNQQEANRWKTDGTKQMRFSFLNCELFNFYKF